VRCGTVAFDEALRAIFELTDAVMVHNPRRAPINPSHTRQTAETWAGPDHDPESVFRTLRRCPERASLRGIEQVHVVELSTEIDGTSRELAP